MKAPEYQYPEAGARWDNEFVWPTVARLLAQFAPSSKRVFELGCGTGTSAGRMSALGLNVTAIDPSESGINAARAANPGVHFEVGGTDDALQATYGQFPVVVSIEVIEHCVSPRRFAECVCELLEPGGYLLLTTPYHGYLKNLALALTGRMDDHYTALWEGGHIKFFSPKTIRELLERAGLEVVRIDRVGRMPPLAKSMVVTARKPESLR